MRINGKYDRRAARTRIGRSGRVGKMVPQAPLGNFFVSGIPAFAILLSVLFGVCCSSRAQAEDTNRRSLRYTSRSSADAETWQRTVRARLTELLKIDDLIPIRNDLAFEPRVVKTESRTAYEEHEIEINTTQERRIRVLVTVPTQVGPPWPAVVCIHGHGGHRGIVHDKRTVYKGFASELAARGYVTIATDVGQHAVQEKGRLLMGERLWDLMRCVDYLAAMPGVDSSRIGCAGLSLGGEMAMWLGGLDTRIAATVSSGFLTRMDQMEQGHCMCWKFDGLRDLVDFTDIYALHAPRPLQCQNGAQEPPSQFPPAIAREVLPEIQRIYADMGAPDNIVLDVHAGGHEIDLPKLLEFFEIHLRPGL